MKKQLFDALKTRIVDRVPQIKTFGLFNNQFTTEKQVNPFKYPAIFVEFSSINWTTQQRGIQIGIANVILHVGVEVMDTAFAADRIDKNSTDLDILDLLNDIHVGVQSFDAEFFTPLVRVAEQQNTDHDNVNVWSITYSTQITDDAAETRYSKPLINFIPDVEQSLTLEINFPNNETNDVNLVGAWWWFTGSNPAVANIYFRFDLLNVDPETIVAVQFNNGNGWITVGSAIRSSFTDGDGINNQFFAITTTEINQFDPPVTNARVVLSGIGHSNVRQILPD